MPHAKALFLVDDYKPQVVRVHITRKQPMRSHEHLDAAIRKPLERRLLLRGRAKARKDFHRYPERLESVAEIRVMLLSQNRRGTQHHHLLHILRGLESSPQGNLGLAEPHIAADEAIHRLASLHIRFHVCNGRKLIGGFLVRKRLLHLALPRRVGAEAEPLHGSPASIHIHQVESEFFCRFPRTSHGARPVSRIQPGQSRLVSFGPHVSRHSV